MITTEKKYIPLNKAKLSSLLRLSIGFTVTGLWLASSVRIDHSLVRIIISGLGIAQIIFFVPLTFSLFKKYKDRKAGITLDNTGITDNTILSAGYIPWSDIYELKKIGQLLIILVTNPKKYISRQSNFVKRKIMKVLFKTYGSPIIITSNELKCDFKKLQNILQAELREHQP